MQKWFTKKFIRLSYSVRDVKAGNCFNKVVSLYLFDFENKYRKVKYMLKCITYSINIHLVEHKRNLTWSATVKFTSCKGLEDDSKQ